MKTNLHITPQQISELVAISLRKIKENISKLKNKSLLKRIGPAKGGHWEIVNNNSDN